MSALEQSIWGEVEGLRRSLDAAVRRAQSLEWYLREIRKTADREDREHLFAEALEEDA